MSAPPDDTVAASILGRIARGAGAPLGDDAFNALALRVFAHQFARNDPYRAFCERRGVSPATATEWQDIPAVPSDAFRAAALVCGDPAAAVATFRTSGTSQGPGSRGVHHFPDLELYEAALAAGFHAHLLPDRARIRVVSLVPPPAAMPDSSLAHMVGEVLARYGAAEAGWFASAEGGIDHAGLVAALRDAADADDPVCILGTAFALVHALDALEAEAMRIRLPAGSRVMNTGGFKGRSREVTREDLYAAIEDRLGIPTAWCVDEYGMTELSSQFYDGVAGSAGPPSERLHRGPGWVRTIATDPETLRSLPHGQVGVLRHHDLANLHSVAAIQTADLGVTAEEGFRVLGRAAGAAARGCSLAMEELLRAVANRG